MLSIVEHAEACFQFLSGFQQGRGALRRGSRLQLSIPFRIPGPTAWERDEPIPISFQFLSGFQRGEIGELGECGRLGLSIPFRIPGGLTRWKGSR